MVEEIPSASGTSIGALASCTASHSERDVHKVSKQFGLGLPIPLTQVEISKGIQIPVILLSSWANFFLSLNLWHTLSGLDSPDDDRCKAQWTSFWRNFEKIMPHHQVFDLARSGSLDLSRTAGIVVHGDEGRSKKKTAIMILSAHSILGKGCAVKNRRATLKTDFAKQDLNIIGNTWTTRWLLGVLPRGYYDPKKGDSEAYDRMSQALVDDMNGVIATGIRSLTGETHWLVPLYVIGDWPFHAKTFHLTRTFGSVAKQPTSKTDSKGICMFCTADQPGYPWEDFESENPRWRTTIGTSCPFARDPAFLQLPTTPPCLSLSSASTFSMDGTLVLERCLYHQLWYWFRNSSMKAQCPRDLRSYMIVFLPGAVAKVYGLTSGSCLRKRSNGCKRLSFLQVHGVKEARLLAYFGSSLIFAKNEKLALKKLCFPLPTKQHLRLMHFCQKFTKKAFGFTKRKLWRFLPME